MELLRKILRGIGICLSLLYGRRASVIFCNILSEVYSGLIACRFHSFKGVVKNGTIKIRGGKYIDIDKNVVLYRGCRIEAYDKHLNQKFLPHIKIEEGTIINCFSQINCVDSITIGKNCGMGANVYISDSVHGEFRPTTFTFNSDSEIPDVFLQRVLDRDLVHKPIVIEDNVHIGQNCVILPGVTIGHNSIISSNSVVNKSIPPYSIATGNPAKVILKCVD